VSEDDAMSNWVATQTGGTMFNKEAYDTLHALVFAPDYAGYRPNVIESPHGDGRLDPAKRFAHIALKYNPTPEMLVYFDLAFEMAHMIGSETGIDAAFLPDRAACAMRILDYPAGAGSEMHSDFDLFTLNLWRNPEGGVHVAGAPCREFVHVGEIGEIVGFGPAVLHEVPPQDRQQQALVFFALPAHSTMLPTGQTVGAWVAERTARSRVYK
jgi:hypothetical protein